MLLRSAFILALVFSMPAVATTQEVAELSDPGVPLKAVSASQPATEAKEVSNVPESSEILDSQKVESQPSQPFSLSGQHHLWARFKPGAWRETQTVTTTLDENGNVVSQSSTTQKETLDAVADDKYVLIVQATVEVGGKQFAGEEQTRILHIETDGADLLSETTRQDDQSLLLPGRLLNCEVWELDYQDGDRNLRDIIHYNAEIFPYIVRRQTLAADSEPPSNETTPFEDNNETVLAEIERTIEVIALETPFTYNNRILNCTSLRTVRQRAKGGSVRLALISREIPGGEVSVTSTEFDALGKSLRFSETSLLGYGGELTELSPAEPSVEAKPGTSEPNLP